MRRITTALALAAVAGLLAPVIFADVKTTQKTTFKLEGMMGRFLNSPKEGIISTIAVKGNRMARMNDATGEIVDLSQEKVYQIDVQEEAVRNQVPSNAAGSEMEEARAKMDKQAQSAKPDEKQAQQPDSQMEIDVAIKETGEHKTISGHETKEVVMTLTMRQKGQKLEEGGGMVTTSDMWIAPRVAPSSKSS